MSPSETNTFCRLSPAEAETRLTEPNGFIIFDVRDPVIHAQQRIDGARSLTPATLAEALSGVPKQQPILIYCYHGISSQDYARTFAGFGFTEVYDLVGGFEGWCAYQAAKARGGNTAIPQALAMWLAEQGFPVDDVNATVENLTTPLMRAARMGEAAIVDALLDCGADVNRRNADGNHALWLACFSGDPETIDLLIAAGADLDNQNDNGASCLMYAASAGKTEVVAQLLKAGAQLELKSMDDFTALDMAANIECLQLLRQASRQAAQTA